ncbi:MAG TPA: DUF5060 domain-containing protein [Bryobacteraceae bacterium]|nr:DUF5060 domain-containing protein [Bryobacteraceae bacterium]
MKARLFAALAVACAAASAQTVCPPTQEFTPCDLVFDVPGSTGDKPLDLQAEFRSPKANTVLARAFWDGGTRWVIRYTPAEAGKHLYRLSGSVAPFAGKQGEITAIDNPSHPGWLRPANLHHFALVDGINYTPYLYMGAVVPGFDAMDRARWTALVDERASQHFNHLAVTLVDSSAADSFRNPEFFRAAEEKIGYANQHGIMIDLAFFGPGLMTKLLPSDNDRRGWFAYALSRLAAFDVVWDGIEAWENQADGPAQLTEIAGYLKAMDPYRHIATTRTLVTSAALPDRSWAQIRSYQTSNDAISGIEQQVYANPAINNFSAGDSTAEAFRHHLWNSTMDGQYPSAVIPDEASGTAMKAWFELMNSTRHWELEPFFDVDNGRGLQLEGVEYVIYVEHPGPVTVTVEKHSYDTEWINPVNGEHTKLKEPCKGETCTASPPDTSHDWILHISREGTKAGMLKSFKFVSRDDDLELQTLEANPDKIPFDITGPPSGTVSLSSPLEFSVKLKRQSKALEHISWLWTAEVGASGRGYRVIGTTQGGAFRLPPDMSDNYPAGLHIRIFAMNGLGKVYSLDRNYELRK